MVPSKKILASSFLLTTLSILFGSASYSGNLIHTGSTQIIVVDPQLIEPIQSEHSLKVDIPANPDFFLEVPPAVSVGDTLDIDEEDDFFMDGESADESEVLSLGEMLNEFVVPFQGKVTSRFGMRRRRMHMGTDINLNLGDTVVAAYHGVVKMARSYFRFGKLVIIEHLHNIETYYSHFSQILVNEGDTVFAGQPVGLGGRTGRATGVHLHFEIRQNGKAFNPELIFDFENNQIRSNLADHENLDQIDQSRKVSSKSVSGISDTGSVHVVRRGDTLGAIARRYGTSVKTLTGLNNISATTILRIGMRLRIR